MMIIYIPIFSMTSSGRSPKPNTSGSASCWFWLRLEHMSTVVFNAMVIERPSGFFGDLKSLKIWLFMCELSHSQSYAVVN